jgi:hypothetical protein
MAMGPFRDGPDKATSTKGEFFAVAVKNSLIIVLFFPTLPYVVVMVVVGLVWLVTRRRYQPIEEQGWGASGDGTTMAERLARMREAPPDRPEPGELIEPGTAPDPARDVGSGNS